MRAKLVLAVAIAGALAAASSGAAVALRAGVVTVTDRGVRPATVTVPAGTRVTWVNRGKRLHAIRSTNGAWAPFTVGPRRSHSVRIGLPGRYPYRVDRRHRGVVVALASPAGKPPYARSTWTGSMTSSGTLAVEGNECHDAFLTILALEVDDNGVVRGLGGATATLPATCTIQPEQPPLTDVTFRVEGTVNAAAFRLRLFPTATTGQLEAGFAANWLSAGGFDPPVQSVPLRTPRSASAQVTLTDTGPYHAGTVTNDITLTCENCAGS
jgi:plastocyanin